MTIPILIPCSEKKAEGSVRGTAVKIVPDTLFELLVHDFAAFRKECPGILAEEQKRLRYFVQLYDAVRNSKPKKLQDVARSLALLDSDSELETLNRAIANPTKFLQEQLTKQVFSCSLVLWKERSSGRLSVGIFCGRGIEVALYAQLLMYIGTGRITKTGECVVCGKRLLRQRGDRRKTCSDACRKRRQRQSAG